MPTQDILAIIPARGGSKGIPRKNLQPVAGKPLVAHSIEQARSAATVTRVVVSTDDREIGDVAVQYGAEVIWRPADISGDHASSESALRHVLTALQQQEGYQPDLVVFLQATSPLRQPDDIDAAVQKLLREHADSLFSAAPLHWFTWRIASQGVRSLNYDFRQRPRRQDAPEDVIETGSIYVFKPWVLLETNNRLGGRIAVYRMDPLKSFQLDEPRDLPVLEALCAAAHPHEPALDLLRTVRLLVFDFDGVMTDNRVMVDQDGKESVFCNRGDGLGLARLRKTGLEAVVLSTEVNAVVAARCRKLCLEYAQACEDKLSALQRMAAERGLLPGEIAYTGNDINDLECMRWVGLPIAVADAVPQVRTVARWTTNHPGGRGAVREIADCFVEARTTAVHHATF